MQTGFGKGEFVDEQASSKRRLRSASRTRFPVDGTTRRQVAQGFADCGFRIGCHSLTSGLFRVTVISMLYGWQ